MRRLLVGNLLLILAAPASAGLPDAGFGDVPISIGRFVHGATQDAVEGTPMQDPGPGPRRHVMGQARFSVQSDPVPAAAPDVSNYSVRGIDVSHYEFDVDWAKVKAAGISFTYIKATEGRDTVDDYFAKNWKNSSAAGVLKGAYHFWNFCRDGASQAANFIKTVPAERGALPPTIDLEESDDCAKMPAKAAFRKDLAVFVQKLEATYGQAPVIYINYSIYDKYFLGENDPYLVWVADVKDRAPSMPDGKSWAMWQYGWHAHVDGVSVEVDVDVFSGTPVQLAGLEKPLDSGVMLAGILP